MSNIEDIFRSCIDHVNDRPDKRDSDFVDFLEEISKHVEVCKDYKEISRVVYSMESEEFELLEKFFGVNDRQENTFSGIFENMQLTEKEKDNMIHFERHVILSCQQRDYLTKMSDSVSEKVKRTQNKVTKIYSEFVGILGVFTALSFALMGSVQVFGNLLSNVSNPNIRTIGYVLVVAGAYLLLIYLVVSMLFIGMKKVFEGNSKYDLSDTFTLVIIIVSAALIILGSLMVVF